MGVKQVCFYISAEKTDKQTNCTTQHSDIWSLSSQYQKVKVWGFSLCDGERASQITRRAIDCLGLPPDLMNKKAGLVVLCTGWGSTSMMHDASSVVRRRREWGRKEMAWPLGTTGLSAGIHLQPQHEVKKKGEKLCGVWGDENNRV